MEGRVGLVGWPTADAFIADVLGYYPEKLWDGICKILQFSVFYPENGSQCRPEHIISITVSRQPLTRSSPPSLLESSAWSPTWQMDRPNPKRHQPDTCRPLETGPWTRSSWTSDATAHAGYAMMMMMNAVRTCNAFLNILTMGSKWFLAYISNVGARYDNDVNDVTAPHAQMTGVNLPPPTPRPLSSETTSNNSGYGDLVVSARNDVLRIKMPVWKAIRPAYSGGEARPGEARTHVQASTRPSSLSPLRPWWLPVPEALTTLINNQPTEWRTYCRYVTATPVHQSLLPTTFFSACAEWV